MNLVLAALIVLLLVLAYLANLRAQYVDVFNTYAGGNIPAGCPDPWKISLAIEHPWAQKLFMSRPIATPIATFALYLIRAKEADVTSLCYGFTGGTGGDNGAVLDALTLRPCMLPGQSPGNCPVNDVCSNLGSCPPTNAQLCAAWSVDTNTMFTKYQVLWDSPIVNLYRGIQLMEGAPTTIVKFPLEILYGAGFLALASLVTTESSTSMDDLWTLCFSEQVPTAAKNPPHVDPCETVGSHAVSGSLGGAGLGLMLAPMLASETVAVETAAGPALIAAGPPGWVVFACLAIGTLVGALGSIFASGQTCCLKGGNNPCGSTQREPRRRMRAADACSNAARREPMRYSSEHFATGNQGPNFQGPEGWRAPPKLLRSFGASRLALSGEVCRCDGCLAARVVSATQAKINKTRSV
jgi:hypothetical protein